MITLSVTTGHAIKALTCLESGDCVPRQIDDIAACTGVPRAYLAKILNTLSQGGLVQTKRGYHGGISLARCADKISLRQIIEAVEGREWIAECLLGLDECGEHPGCPMHDFWGQTRVKIIAKAEAITLADLIHNRCALKSGSPSACAASPKVECLRPAAKTKSARTKLSVNS